MESRLWWTNPTVLQVDSLWREWGRRSSPKWLGILLLGLVRLMAKGAVYNQCTPGGKSISHGGVSWQFWNCFTCKVSNNNGHRSKWTVDNGARFFTVWEGNYRWAKGGHQKDPCDTRVRGMNLYLTYIFDMYIHI